MKLGSVPDSLGQVGAEPPARAPGRRPPLSLSTQEKPQPIQFQNSTSVRSADQERETLPVASDEKRVAVDCTAAQAVVVLLLASVIPSRRADQGRDCGAAEIQRVVENAPRWPDMKTRKSREVRNHGRRAARHVLSWSGWRHLRGRPTPRFQNNSGLSQGPAGASEAS